MEYSQVCRGIFRERPNRFIARVEIEGVTQDVHVRNTGRCRELLVPGAVVYLEPGRGPNRRTAYSLVAVEKAGRLINMDSQAPNAAAREWIAGGGLGGVPTRLVPEAAYGGSRLDFYVEIGRRRAYVEVKGVTLEREGHVYFPDAPTARGARHLRELAAAVAQGCEGWVLFVIQMEGAVDFAPNRDTDPAFADALAAAQEAGVRAAAVDCRVTPQSMTIRGPVPFAGAGKE